MWTHKLPLLSLLLLFCLQSGANSLRILGIFPLNSKSHHVVCEQLAKALAAKGHQLDVYSHFPLKKPMPNYRDHSLEGSLPDLSNNLTYDMAIQFQAHNVKTIVENVGTPTCRLMELPVFKELREKSFKEPYDLIILEVFIADCYLAWGRHLNIPMVGVMTMSLIDWYNFALGNPFSTAVTPAIGSKFDGPMNFWQRLSNTVLSKTISALFKYICSEQDEYVERIFGKGYPTVSELQKDLDLLLLNTHSSLEGNRAYTPAIIPIAGLHVVDDGTLLPKEVKKWLDESKDGCIYVSFGSMIRIETFPKPIIDAFYATFKKIAPVRVIMKIAKPELLPPDLPSNVITHTWLPQIQVLRHKNIKAFITQGGLMSSLESIHYGVPMLGIPIFGDQHHNIQSNVRRGISAAIQIDNITEHTLTAVLNDVLYNPVYKESSEKLRKTFVDRPMTPIDTAIFWVEYIVRHGKGALRSPLVDISWWQEALLDIYAFIALVFYIIYYIFRFLLKKIIGFCCRGKNNVSSLKLKKNI